METITYDLKAGTLNDIYDQIINCRVVKPPQEKKGMYNAEFFLDKRLGLSYLYKSDTYQFIDEKRIGPNTYYIYKDGNAVKMGILNGSTLVDITPSGLNIDTINDISIATGRGPSGSIIKSGTLGSSGTFNQASGTDILDVQGYSGGYVSVTLADVTGLTAGMYITFTTGGLKGVTNKIYNIVGNVIWIIGTTVRGSIPAQGDQYIITGNTGQVIIIGHSTGVDMLITNGISQMNRVKLLDTPSPVIDICNYDGNIFVLLQYRMYFSRSNLDSNTNFYPLDNFIIDNGKALFPIGKSLIVFADTNKLFAAASTTSNSIGYVGYDINYATAPYSKDSFIFSDNMVQVVQADKQLMKIDLIQSNNTAFDINATNIMANNRGLFEEIEGGTISAFKHDRFHSYVNVYNGKTRIYEFDKQYNHWLIHDYNCEIRGVYPDHILTNKGIAVRNGYLDDGQSYAQEVNFALYSTTLQLTMPWIMRTMFGLIEEPIDLNLDIEIEIGGRLDTKHIDIQGYTVDHRLHTDNHLDELLEQQAPNKYDGSIFSIQNSIYKSGRYFRFCYNGFNRFCIGPSLSIITRYRPFINELIGTK